MNTPHVAEASAGDPSPAGTGSGPAMAALAADVRRCGLAAGLAAVGVAPAAPMLATRRLLEERKAAGLSGGMQFTYRDPARSTDPERALPGAKALVVGAWRYAPVRARPGAGYGAAGDQGPGDRGAGDRGAGHTPSQDHAPEGAGQSASPPSRTAGDDRPRSTPADDRPRSTPADDRAPSTAGDDRPMGLVARYAVKDHYADLRSALNQVASLLRAAGWAARVVADDNAMVDRAAAALAGLGWFGKNSNILLPGQGSWFLLGSVVTDAPLPPDAGVVDGCGPCRRCLTACPTGALVAPGVLDARRCLAWLLQAAGTFPFEFREALGSRIYGCDDCQEICPANRAADPRVDLEFRQRGAEAGLDLVADLDPGQGGPEGAVDLLWLLNETDDVIMAAFGRWYIPRREPRYLRRNALIALGNVADGRAPAVEAVLRRYLADSDEMLAAHAVWAAARSGRHDLLSEVPGVRDHPGQAVRAELERAGQVAARDTRSRSGGARAPSVAKR
ncbi:MAG TPA: tRNA epoxyqueuosine(34) reductase QueG [Acidimicrobiales bacterium]|nr:tRNA epoxyqueuosine(34) reductase QueG [Acidimicrobiales bacterium]